MQKTYEGESEIKSRGSEVKIHAAYDELRDINGLKPNPQNPNKHPQKQIELLAKMIKEQGWRAPITVSNLNGYVVRGHARLEAAKLLGLKQVPVDLQDYDSPEMELADLIADNRIAELAEMSLPDLKDILESLDTGAFDMDLTGFSDKAIEELMTQFNLPDTWNPDPDKHDNIEEIVGYNLSSLWKDFERPSAKAYPYMLELPVRTDKHSPSGAGGLVWSRTNELATERIVRTYMRQGDIFYEMCSGWVTFSSTAKYWGFSGKASDIWETAIEFDKKQIAKMPGNGTVKILKADCRQTGESDNTYDFVHSNPPFFSLEEYSDNPNDLSGLGSYDRWLVAMVDMAKEAERILKPNGLASFVLNDYRKDSYLVNMHADFMSAILKGTNLKMWDMVVAEVISQSLRFRKKAYEARRTVKCHEYIMTFKK